MSYFTSEPRGKLLVSFGNRLWYEQVKAGVNQRVQNVNCSIDVGLFNNTTPGDLTGDDRGLMSAARFIVD